MQFGRFARAARLAFAGLVLGALLAGCERPPVDSVQRGYRGTSMIQVYNPRTLDAQAELNAPPAEITPARVRANAPKAGQVYQNVKVLGDLSIGEFGRTMNAITAWVSPTQSCSYCHVDGNFADDSKYTKVVARRMLQMTQHLNANWKAHVGQTGVTCYTCHRGNPLPVNTWFNPLGVQPGADFIGGRNGQNAPAPAVGLASLPSEPFYDYFRSEETAKPIRVAGGGALPAGNRSSIQQAEYTYSLMIHMSKALGVNCTYCHNSRAFANWPESTPQRATAWHGIRMVRDVNSQFLDPLSGTFPAVPEGRLGPAKDAAKVNCTTCHQGAYKPLYGAAMAPGYPALLGADDAKAWMERALAQAEAAAAAAAAAEAAAAAASAASAAPGK